MQALVFPSVKSFGQSSAPVSQIIEPHRSVWESNIFYVILLLTNVSFTEVFRVSTQFVMAFAISVLVWDIVEFKGYFCGASGICYVMLWATECKRKVWGVSR